MRSIISVNEGGIGNRLSCIAFSYYIRDKKFPERNFYIYWPITQNFACPLHRLLEIDPKYILTLDDFHSMLCEWKIEGGMQDILVQNDSNPNTMKFDKWNKYYYIFNTIPWNKKLVSCYGVWDYAMNQNLFSISDEIYDRIKNINFNIKKCIGIHVRRGDVIWHNRVHSLEKFFRFIDKHHPDDNLYIAAEDTTGEIFRGFVKRYGKKRVNKYPTRGYDRHNEEHCFDAFVEWFLLSKTLCIIDGVSSYSEIASWFGKIPLKILS
jgi:hypothetical protein